MGPIVWPGSLKPAAPAEQAPEPERVGAPTQTCPFCRKDLWQRQTRDGVDLWVCAGCEAEWGREGG